MNTVRRFGSKTHTDIPHRKDDPVMRVFTEHGHKGQAD